MRQTYIPQPIKTPRLLIRPFLDSDAEAAFAAWLGDPEVMRFTPGGPDKSVETTRKRLAMYRQHQDSQGFSKWMVLDQASGAAIGDSGLLSLDSAGRVDLNLRLARAHWGRGLGTDVVLAWSRVAFEDLGLERLTAFAHSENHGLCRVLEKSGFRAEGAATLMEMQALAFVLEAEAFRMRA
jgi:RimJ/RimL family protein N-acetyltransferase